MPLALLTPRDAHSKAMRAIWVQNIGKVIRVSNFLADHASGLKRAKHINKAFQFAKVGSADTNYQIFKLA